MSIEQQITGILSGIDRYDDHEGYWDTSTGVEFGSKILADVKDAARLFDDNYKVKREAIKTLKLEMLELKAAIKYATDYLDDNKLNSIGYGSKAHNELLNVLTKGVQQA